MKIDDNRNSRFARPGDKVELGRVLITDGALDASARTRPPGPPPPCRRRLGHS